MVDSLKNLFNNEEITETELQDIKDILTSSFVLSDMPDIERENIQKATLEDYKEIFIQSIVNTIQFSIKIRTGY